MGSKTERVETPVTSGRRILVVDDEHLVCESVKWMLLTGGYEVEVASNGKDALELYAPGRFDLVIIDYLMPVMKGDELAELIRAREPRQPIIMISASGDMLRTSGRPPVAVNSILSKPFQLEELRDAVAAILPEKGSLDTGA